MPIAPSTRHIEVLLPSGTSGATYNDSVTAAAAIAATASESNAHASSPTVRLAALAAANTDATFNAVGTIQQSTGATQEFFPATCLKNDGSLLRISRAGTSHLSTDGNLIAATCSAGADPTVAANWSAQSTILNKTTDLRGGIPRLLANGKIMVALWETEYSGATIVAHRTYTMLSTDTTATAWSTPVQLPNHTGQLGNACESGVVEMPNGDLLLVVYESESSGGTTGWSTVLYKSTDGGASWSFSTYIARSADSAAPPQALYEEPFLLRLFNGELVCAIRQSEQGWTAGTLRYVHLHRSRDDGTTWTDEGRVFSSFQSASRNAMFQTRDGAVVLQARILGTAGASKQGAYIVSNDDCHTWGTLRNLEDGTAVASATSPPVFSYGDITQLANGKLGQIWCDETPLSGSGCAIRFGTFTLTGRDAESLTHGLTATASLALATGSAESHSHSASPVVALLLTTTLTEQYGHIFSDVVSAVALLSVAASESNSHATSPTAALALAAAITESLAYLEPAIVTALAASVGASESKAYAETLSAALLLSLAATESNSHSTAALAQLLLSTAALEHYHVTGRLLRRLEGSGSARTREGRGTAQALEGRDLVRS